MVIIVPSRGAEQFNLRLPDGMREQLKEAAAANGRSLNSEIVHRLQTTLEMDSYTPGDNAQMEGRVDDLEAKVVELLQIIRTAKVKE